MRGRGLLRAEGRIKEEIEHEGTVVIGQNAAVRAKLQVKELVVQGFSEDSIQAERCEIAETARIVGDLRAKRLAVAEGASIQSDLQANQPEDEGATRRSARPVVAAEAAVEQS